MSYNNQGLQAQPASERKRTINARSKGRRGEQEVATMLREVVAELGAEVEIKRNQNQTAGAHRGVGQGDLIGLEFLSIEIKRVESDLPSSLESWWNQTKAQASKSQTPVLFHRMNDREWEVRTRIETVVNSQRIRLTVDMAWPMYRVWLKERIKQEYGL